MTYCKLCGVNKEITGYCKCNDGSRENHLAILVEQAGVEVVRLRSALEAVCASGSVDGCVGIAKAALKGGVT